MSKRNKIVPDIKAVPDLDGTDPLPNEISGDTGFEKTMVLEGGADATVAEPPVEQLQPGSVLRDRYLLKERIGAGSMGQVFKALDRHLSDASGADALVAIKVLTPELIGNPDALRALQQEAAKGRLLVHPGIVRFIDLDRDDQMYFIVMEWLDGQSLADALDAGLLTDDLPRALDIIRQLASALGYAHQRGVVHADIKPGNVVLLPDGAVKLIDFGIARMRQLGRPGGQPTQPMKAATPSYSSMQVLTGELPVAADDIFSLACLTYRMLAGHRVFGPRNAAEAAESGIEPQRPGSINDSQWQALRKGLSHARVARQQTPAEFFEGLTAPVIETLSHEPLSIPDDEIIQRRFEDSPSRWPWVVMLMLVGAGAVAFLLKPPWLATGIQAVESFISDVQQRAAGDPLPAEVQEPDENTAATADSPADMAPVSEVPSELPVTSDASVPAVADGDAEIEEFVEPGVVSESVPAEAPAEPRLEFGNGGSIIPRLELSVTENGPGLSIELQRQGALSESLLVRVDEVGFSGSRSPGKAGGYVLSGDGVVRFDPGQAVATLVIEASPDSEREPDRRISLSLRDYYNAESVLGQLEVRLLDDDQRAFEANLPPNSVAFVRRQAVVRESDPAAQIDILRYNPDNETLSVRYFARDLTATEGEDYFAPTQGSVTLGPGQRNARLLISLVQDTVAEGDERFMVELDPELTYDSTISEISVTILDDDASAE